MSAAVEGTKKLYLDDFSLLHSEASVIDYHVTSEGDAAITLDQTCLYPGGGGQACDTGTITWKSGAIVVDRVDKDKQGVVTQYGALQGEAPNSGERVRVSVDVSRRLLNSRLHCAGHILDLAVKRAGKDWKSGKSAHYPHMSFVDYDGAYDPTESQCLIERIQNELQVYIQKGGAVGIRSVPSAEAHLYSDYIPEAILRKYQNVHLATYPDNFNVCCGGTHVADLSEVGTVTITKMKKRDGHIRISYALEQ